MNARIGEGWDCLYEGKALDWFHGYEAYVKDLNWKTFAANIIMQLGLGMYANLVGQITKSRQASLVQIYQEWFEALMVRTRGLIEEFFIQCFISGLRDTIKNYAMMFQPTTLIQVIGLVLILENTMEATIMEAKFSSRITTRLVPRMQEVGRGISGQIPPIRKIS